MSRFRTLSEVDLDAVDEYIVMVLSYMHDSMTRVFGDEKHFYDLLRQYILDTSEYFLESEDFTDES